MRDYTIRFETLPNQGAVGTFELVESHPNRESANASAQEHLRRLNGTKIRDKQNRAVSSVQWKIALISYYKD